MLSTVYSAAVTFKANDSTVTIYKSEDVDTVTATSGRKVYTLHWIPTSLVDGKVTKWEVYINVAVYA